MRVYTDTSPIEALACALCLKQGSCTNIQKAQNFWNVTSHIQSKAHLQALPTMLPREDQLGQWLQQIDHPEGMLYFNHLGGETWIWPNGPALPKCIP